MTIMSYIPFHKQANYMKTNQEDYKCSDFSLSGVHKL